MKPMELLVKILGGAVGVVGALIIYGALSTGGEAIPFLPIGCVLVALAVILAFLPRK